MKASMRTTQKGALNQQEVKLNTDKLVKDMQLKSKELQCIIRYRGVANMRFYASITTLD